MCLNSANSVMSLQLLPVVVKLQRYSASFGINKGPGFGMMDFDAVFSDPHTVHRGNSWDSLLFLHTALMGAISGVIHSPRPTPLQWELLQHGTRDDFLTVLTGHKASGKTTALCLYALTTALSRSEIRPSVLVLTPDDVRAKSMADLLATLMPTVTVATASSDGQIAVYSLSPHSLNRLNASKDTLIKTITTLILDDSEECLSTKEWRLMIGGNLVAAALRRKGTATRLNCLFAQRNWREWNSKFVQELEANLVKEYQRAFPKRELTCTPFTPAFRYFYLTESAEDAIKRLFQQDRVVIHPPVLIVTRELPISLAIKSRLETLDLRAEVLNSAEQTTEQDDLFNRFTFFSLRYLIVYPELTRRYQTVSPGSVILAGVPMRGNEPNVEQLWEEMCTGVRYGSEGDVVLLLRSDAEATWLQEQLKVVLSVFPR